MSRVNKCQGCGATLQTAHEDQVGYVKSLDQAYCKSCYQLMHYGIGSTHFHPEDLPELKPKSLILMVSSILHLDLLFSYPVYRYQMDATFVYIINQIDLLPEQTNFDLLVKNIQKKANENKIPLKDIILMSSKNPYDIDELKNYLREHNHKHVYLVGVQNSGKTTIFKALTENDKALAFKKAGLTQETLISQFEDQVIYDMPGLYQKGYLHQVFPYEIYKRLIPDRQINVKIYQMKQGQSIFLEGIYAVTLDGKDTTFTFYVDPSISFHKTNQLRVNALIDERKNHFNIYGDEYVTQTFKIPEGKHHITFADMGFMHIMGPNRVTITYVKSLHLSLMEALFS